MSDRPSDDMELDELRDEYDWMYEFQSLMAERIRGDADVHNLVDYVSKLQAENAKLRELVRILYYCGLPWKDCDKCAMNGAEMHVEISDVEFCDGMYDRMRELGVETEE